MCLMVGTSRGNAIKQSKPAQGRTSNNTMEERIQDP